jgi:hypothetical protein
MKKLLTALALFILPVIAHAQTFPTPSYNDITIPSGLPGTTSLKTAITNNATAAAAANTNANTRLLTTSAGPLATQAGANSAAAIAAGQGYTSVAIPQSYQTNTPDLIADYAHQLFMARVEGQETLSSFGGTTYVGGATGSATYLDPSGVGHFSISGAPRFTSSRSASANEHSLNAQLRTHALAPHSPAHDMDI